MKKILYIYGIIGCLLVGTGRAGATEFFFRHVDIAEGLPQMSVADIYQDAEGFMWFATRQGLARYDGAEMVVYNPVAGDTTSLCNSVVEQVEGDEQGHVYIRSTGINRYDLRTRSMRRIWSGMTDMMAATEDGVVFAAGDSLYRYTAGDGRIVGMAGLPSEQVGCIAYVGEKWWLGTVRGEVYTLSAGGEMVLRYALGSRISCIYEDASHVVWIGTWEHGLYSLSPRGLTHIDTSQGLASNYVRAVYEDGMHTLWVGTDIGLQHQVDKAVYLPGQSVWALCGDAGGNLWVGTYFDGISFFNPSIDFYRSIPVSFDRFPVISAMVELADGRIFLSTEGEGMYIIDRGGKILWHRELQNIKATYYDESAGKMYLGTHLGGLCILDLRTMEVEQHTVPYTEAHYGNHIVREILPIGEDSLLIGTHNGIYTYDTQTADFQLFAEALDSVMPKVVAMQMDRHGHLYVGGEDLWVYDMETGGLRQIALPFTGIEKLRVDSHNHVWIGSDGSGVWCYYPSGDSLRAYSQSHGGLQNDFVRNIYLSESGSIFVLTTKGFSVIEEDREQVVNYLPGLYLPLSSLYNGGLLKLRNGEMLLAGMDGLIAFREEALHRLQTTPRIVLKKLYINSLEAEPLPPHRLKNSRFCGRRFSIRIRYG